MIKLPPISPAKLSFKSSADCLTAQLHLATFGSAVDRKACIEKFKILASRNHIAQYPFLSDDEQDAVVMELKTHLDKRGGNT